MGISVRVNYFPVGGVMVFQDKKTLKFTFEMGNINLKRIVFYVPLCRAKRIIFINGRLILFVLILARKSSLLNLLF